VGADSAITQDIHDGTAQLTADVTDLLRQRLAVAVPIIDLK
jgi:hypothetical protein